MRLIRRINGITLRKKILLLAVGAELLILGVASVLGMYMLSSNHAQLSQTMANSLVYMSERLEQTLDSAKALTGYILADDTIQNQLSLVYSNKQTPERLIAYHTLYDSVVGFHQQYRQLRIRYISLVNDAFTVNSTISAFDTPQDVMDDLRLHAVKNNGIPYVETRWSDSYGLFISRAIRQVLPFNLQVTGVVIVCLDINRLVEDATTFNNAYENSCYMLSDGGALFYQSPGLSGSDIITAHESLKGDYSVVHLENGVYFAQRGVLGDYGWEYISLVPYGEQWRGQRNSYLLFLLILLAAMLVTAGLSNWIARSISGDFTALVDKMRLFRGQRMQNGTPAEPARTDEVGLLHRHFDRMAGEITELIQERYVNELLTKNAQLKALEAQTNPHFLYNVLEGINWRAQKAGVMEISQIVDALGRFLRVSLDPHKELITLGEELSLVDHYIVIQRFRFEDQMEYSCQVPTDLLRVMIPKLVIQPLVENAVRYAVEANLDSRCLIRVTANAVDGMLTVDVENSGSTFEDGLLDSLRSGEVRPHGFGIGLINIDERLKLTFGESFGLQLFSRNGCAVCRLRIPMNQSIGSGKQGEEEMPCSG